MTVPGARGARIGVLGSDSTHVDAFLRHFNVESRYPGLRITSALSANPDRDEELTDLGVDVAPSTEALLAGCDGVIVAHRDGRTHASFAGHAISAGRPTFVDKPLATTQSDATRLVRTASRMSVPLGTGSVMQWHPGVLASRGKGSSRVVVVGPAQLDCRHGGLFFYGIHAAEAACAVALAGATGPLPEEVTVELKGDEVVVRARLAGCRIELRLLDAPPGEGDFRMDLGDGERVLGLPEDYLAPVSSTIAGVMAGTPETGLGPAVAATTLLEAATCQLRRN